MAVDYGAIQPVNALGSLMGGYQAGQQLRQQKGRQNALAKYASGDAEGASKDLIASGDLETGVALRQQASADAARQRRVDIGKQYAGGDATGAHTAAQSSGDFDLDAALSKLDDNQRAAVSRRAEDHAQYALSLKPLPYAERKAKLAADQPKLLAMGYTQAQLDGFDPTDPNLDQVAQSSLDVKTRLERGDKAQLRQDTLHKPDWKERKKGPTGETEFVDLNPNNAPTGADTSAAPEAASPASQASPHPTGGVYDSVAQLATKAGAKPEEVGYLQTLAQVESHGDPKAQNGRSTGLFQFHPDTFAAAGGGGDIHDIGAQTSAALNLSRRDRANLSQLGIEPTDANVYIMHQQGAGGGRALLTSPPDINAVAALTPVYGNADVAKRAIVGNGGTADMSAGQFVDMWRSRWANGGRPVTTGAAQGGATAPQLPTGEGLVKPGNLDPWNRPILHNPAGGYSTTSSISIGTDQGEVLIPTVVDGKRLSNQDAIAHFKATGENFGTFASPDAADKYAQELHNRQDAYVQAHGGPQGFKSGGQAAPVATRRGGPPTVPGSVAQVPKVVWHSDGKGHLVNENGDRKDDPTSDQAGAVDPNIVKGLIEGRITPPTQKAAATPYWQAQLQAAAAQDPQFDMVNFQARSKARADFTSGKSAVNITALNTVVGHLNTLDQAVGKLGNTGGFLGSTLNNKAAHWIARESGTDERLGTFAAAKTAVANEMTRVFRGTGGAEADIQGYLRDLDAAKSPETLRATIKQMAELINSRIEALGEQYNQGMGTTKDPLTLLTPDKQRAFNRLMGKTAAAPAPTAGSKARPSLAEIFK